MVLNSIFGKQMTVGIDIGANSIKVVEVEPAGEGWQLASAAVVNTPPESVKDGIITDVPEVAGQIKQALKEAGVKATGAIAAISGSQVIVRQVDFPKMPAEVLRKSIKFEAARFISSSMEDSVVEFEILGDAEEPGKMNVMLVAAPRDMVESRVNAIEAAGLEPLVIDVEAFALIRSLVDFNASDTFTHKGIALIDVGASHTDVNIVKGGEFALTRNIPIAGDAFTNAIKSMTGVGFEEAEKMKLEMTSEASLAELAEGETDNQCWRVVNPLVDELIREIRRSIHFYQSQFPEGSSDAAINEVVLTGGSARMPGIADYLSSNLNMPVEIATVFNQTAVGTGNMPSQFVEDHGPVLAVGTGLAVKEFLPEPGKQAA